MLKRFKTDVIDRGAEACLPCNLTDEWLSAIARSADDVMSGIEEAGGSIALAAFLTIFSTKKGAGEFTGREDEMLELSRIELGLEELHRKTGLPYEPATVATILTNRQVPTWHKTRG